MKYQYLSIDSVWQKAIYDNFSNMKIKIHIAYGIVIKVQFLRNHLNIYYHYYKYKIGQNWITDIKVDKQH